MKATVYEYQFVRKKERTINEASIEGPKAVIKFATKTFLNDEELGVEKLYAIAVKGGAPVGFTLLSSGNTDKCTVDNKLLARLAVDTMASGMVLIHNHPDGNPRPTGSDIKATEKAKKCLALFDVTLLDHVVLGEGLFFSFESGKIDSY